MDNDPVTLGYSKIVFSLLRWVLTHIQYFKCGKFNDHFFKLGLLFVSLIFLFLFFILQIPSFGELSKLMSWFYVFWPASEKNKIPTGRWEAVHISNVKPDFSLLIVSVLSFVIFCLMYFSLLTQASEKACCSNLSWEHPHLLHGDTPIFPDKNLHRGKIVVKCEKKYPQINKYTDK